MLICRHDRILEISFENKLIKDPIPNLKSLDSMNDFILTMFIEFSIKSYVSSENPRPGQKISLK